MKIVAVTGLAAEAALARRNGIAAVCGGGDRDSTRAAIRRAIDDGAEALLSFGIAGGLAPGLPPGTIIVADRVCGIERLPLQLVLPGLRGPVTGVAAPVTTAAEKAELHARTGALCADLETGLVAASGLPYAVVRALGDPAERDVPPAALVGLRPDGMPAIGAVLRSLWAKPRQLPALIQVAFDTRAALHALGRITLPRAFSA